MAVSNKKAIQYRAGDILTACDNEWPMPDGLFGHSAVVISSSMLIDSVMTNPVRQSTIRNFLRMHPKHAVYRPRKPMWGRRAAVFAQWYLQQRQLYRQKGVYKPPFLVSPRVPMEDPWSSTYCSKLVWLCYHYGVGYSMPHAYFLFTPENLDTALDKDKANFIRLYKHPQFRFIWDS